MPDLWYKTAVIYCLDVETYQDSDGDGVGDFAGLTRRLDHIAGLGATSIWLLPFYPSPNRDNGYDVMDYYGVDPRLGTLGDFVEFTHRARERGLRVIVDLVVNHTSDQHPWFRAARSDPKSKYRDWYVWSETKPADAHDGVVFAGVQDSIWTYDEAAEAYYLHRFYYHQPDLNIANPAVREEIARIMGFWLELGVSGFRLDAAPFLIELRGVEADVGDKYRYLRELREFLSWRRGDAILLAEANVGADTIPEYFGDGDRMHLLFNFLVNQHLFLALARRRAEPLARGLRAVPRIPASGQWANFLRNHDELDLARLSDREREDVYRAFAPEPGMRLYGRGIRRRIAPMLDGDRRRMELAHSLLLSLPGTPVLRYGEEIGMGDDLSLPERNAVRTPMQWTDGPNAGFSSAAPEELIRPVITEGPFGKRAVNVAAQGRDDRSFLNWLERAIRTRRDCPEFGWGAYRLIETDRPGVFAHRCDWQGGAVVAVHNLTDQACLVELELEPDEAGRLVDVIADGDYPQADERDPRRLRLGPYGYRWLRIDGGEAAAPSSPPG